MEGGAKRQEQDIFGLRHCSGAWAATEISDCLIGRHRAEPIARAVESMEPWERRIPRESYRMSRSLVAVLVLPLWRVAHWVRWYKLDAKSLTCTLTLHARTIPARDHRRITLSSLRHLSPSIIFFVTHAAHCPLPKTSSQNPQDQDERLPAEL